MADRKPRIYLDWNATAPLHPRARGVLVAHLDAGNPSSVHDEGRSARAAVERARRSLSRLVGGSSENLVFTSGASEAAATLLSPSWLVNGTPVSLSRLAVLDTDHACLRSGGSFAPEAVDRLGVDRNGLLDFAALDGWLNDLPGGETALLAVTAVNGETGVVQPLAEIASRLHDRPVLFVADCVQWAGRMPLSLDETGADAIFLSGHKMGAGKGAGAFVTKTGETRPMPLLRGGGQEKGRRAGTETVGAIASMGEMAEIAIDTVEERQRTLRSLQSRLERGIAARLPSATILGEAVSRSPNTTAVVIEGMASETAVMALDLQGFAVSGGSACSSGKVGRSHVLDAMARGGLPVDPADGLLRISFGYETADDEIDGFVSAFASFAGRFAGAQKRVA